MNNPYNKTVNSNIKHIKSLGIEIEKLRHFDAVPIVELKQLLLPDSNFGYCFFVSTKYSV